MEPTPPPADPSAWANVVALERWRRASSVGCLGTAVVWAVGTFTHSAVFTVLGATLFIACVLAYGIAALYSYRARAGLHVVSPAAFVLRSSHLLIELWRLLVELWRRPAPQPQPRGVSIVVVALWLVAAGLLLGAAFFLYVLVRTGPGWRAV